MPKGTERIWDPNTKSWTTRTTGQDESALSKEKFTNVTGLAAAAKRAKEAKAMPPPRPTARPTPFAEKKVSSK